MQNDGYITIGTKLDTKDLEKELKKAEAELLRYNKRAEELLKQKTSIEIETRPYREAREEIEKTYEERIKLAKTQENARFLLEEEELALEELNKEYSDLINKADAYNNEVNQNYDKIDGVKSKIKEINAELSERNNLDNIKTNLEGVKQSTDGIEKKISGFQTKISGIVSSVIKWGLAIFSIRSAYNFIRGSISTVSQYNQKMATNIEYIRWALAMTLKPVIEFIVNLAYKLLGILRAVIKTLFHYDIFAKAGADQFMKAKKSTSGIDNNLGKSVKKAKELNKQLASFDEMNILGDNTKMAGDTDGGTAGDVGGTELPLPKEIPDIELKFKINWDNIYDAIENVTDWASKKVKGFFDDLGDKWIEKGKDLGGVLGAWSELIGNFFKTTGEFAGTWIQGIGRTFKGLVEIVQGIFSGDITKVISGALDVILGIVQSWIGAFGQMLNVLATSLKAPFVALISIVKDVIKDISDRFKKLNLAVKWDNLVSGLNNTIDKIKTKIKSLKTWISNTFKNIGTSIGKVFQSAFKTIFNKLVSAIENRLNTPINAINSMIGVINKLLPKKQELSKLKRISLPRLAKGGIVNMPSRGVPVGTAIAGERGAEGVIPLTDSQQMALLGEAIGKYITINANITNTMNGRVISRELQKIQSDNNFAYNR